MPAITPDIFKAYDIRGVYPSEVNEDVFRLAGRAFVAYLRAGRIGVSRDMRLSSASLAAAFIDGAREQGADIVDYGMLGTDVLYFAVCRDELDGGAQITASHNPREYNGVKLVGPKAFPLSGDAGISDMREMILGDAFPAPTGRRGRFDSADVLDDYIERVLSFIDPAVIRPFHAVLDAGSGMAGLIAPRLFDRLPCHTSRLCFEVDGTFPNHEANPLIAENRRDIVHEVLRSRADVGIAWDGDADRCFFVDGGGEFVAGDFVTTLLAEVFLLKHPEARIVYDVRASYAVKDTVTRRGGVALMNRVGHAFFKKRMREEDAVFGGEVTGHYYFRDFYFADNGFIPALLILELMSTKGRTLGELLEPLRECYFISGEINTRVASMDEVGRKLDGLAQGYADAPTVYRMDGLSVEYPDWHFNVRPSNTEPLLRLNLEAASAELMGQRRDEVLSYIRA